MRINFDRIRVIHKYQKKEEITLKDLAKELGVSYSSLSNWNNGRSVPGVIGMLITLRKKYKISIDDMIDGN